MDRNYQSQWTQSERLLPTNFIQMLYKHQKPSHQFPQSPHITKKACLQNYWKSLMFDKKGYHLFQMILIWQNASAFRQNVLPILFKMLENWWMKLVQLQWLHYQTTEQGQHKNCNGIQPFVNLLFFYSVNLLFFSEIAFRNWKRYLFWFVFGDINFWDSLEILVSMLL